MIANWEKDNFVLVLVIIVLGVHFNVIIPCMMDNFTISFHQGQIILWIAKQVPEFELDIPFSAIGSGYVE